MSNNDELDVQWDADVIEFWQASLQSYKTCHDGGKSKDIDPERIASNLIDSLPKKIENRKAPLSSTSSSEPPLHPSEPTTQKLQNNNVPRPRAKPGSHIEEEGNRTRMTDRLEDHTDELDSRLQIPTKRKASVVSKDSNLPPARRNVQIDKEEEEYEGEQEEEEEEEEEYSYENTSKKARYQDNQQEYYYQHPQYAAAPAPSPMPPSMPTQDNEAFSNLIMSWYYAGYYTGLYQARQR